MVITAKSTAMLTTVLEQNSVLGHLFHIRLLKLSFWFWLAPKRQRSISAGSESFRKTLMNNEAALLGMVVCGCGNSLPFANARWCLHQE